MPGLSFVYDLRRDLGAQARAIAAALEATLHDERYAARVVCRDATYFLGFSGYPEYPLTSHRVGNCDIHLEGRLYGLNAAGLDTALAKLTGLMTRGGRDGDLAAWLLDADGDFVIYVFDRETGAIWIVNDVLGRLPLYCHRAAQSLVLSRDLRFIAKLMPRLQFDRMAIAQSLLLGYPLGGRMLVDGVERLDGGTLLRIGANGQGVSVSRLHEFNFEPKARAASSTRDNAVELVELFTRACSTRSQSGCANVISLSGGFDARSIAAGFHAAAIPFSCATFVDHIGNAAAEVKPAEQVAALFDSPWKLLALGPPDTGDILKLLRLKSGMNSLAMAFLLPFLARVREEWGSTLWFSSGEMALCIRPEVAPDVTPVRRRGLIEHLIVQAQKLPLDLVARLSMLDRDEIVAELEAVVADYPETALGQKLVHFVVVERALRWHSEGEDRNRCYFWTTSPFSNPRYFLTAMSCPDAQKRYYGLYREFLHALSPAAAAIVHAGIGAAINSERFRLDAKAAALLAHHPGTTAASRRIITPQATYRSDSTVIRWLREQIASCPLLLEYIAEPVLEDVLLHCADYAWDRMDLLFSVTAAIEDLGTGRSVLQR